MQTMVIDPTEQQQDDMARQILRGRPRFAPWYITDADTDPRPKLLTGGWQTYETVNG
jgi:hypothetical protein